MAREQDDTERTLRDPDAGEVTRPSASKRRRKRSSEAESESKPKRERSRKSRGERSTKSEKSSKSSKSKGKSRTRARASVREGKREGGSRRRHPDIEVARLLVKRGHLDKAQAVDVLKLQKLRAKEGKRRIPFLQLLVKQRLLPALSLPQIQDEIRSNTYICDRCEARAVLLAASRSRSGACPRCGAPIEVAPASEGGVAAPRSRELAQAAAEADSEGEGERASGTVTWRPMGDRRLRQFEPGMVAFDRYLLREELGRGAMGVVYRARHMELAKEVALKVLVPSEDSWEQQVERFRREAAAVQKLRHEGIVQVHDFGSDGEVYYLTMDLVEGGESLHRRLKREPSAPLAWRLGVVAAVARAIGHAHERGVIHRDLKPANVLLTPAGTPLVADFGLAKDEEADGAELTRTQDRLGTPLFMAPEQIKLGASTVDGKADTWALGVILFVCVTGRYPFRSRTVLELYARILQEEPDWDGSRFSAPERQGFKPHDSSSGALVATKTSPGSAGANASSEDVCDATEAGARTPSGKLPRTLPEQPPGFALEAPKPPFLPPVELGGAPPPQLRKIIRCALAKDKNDRYPSAEDLAADIERFLAGEPVQGGGPGVTKRVRQALDRKQVLKPLAMALGLIALLGVAAGVAGLVHVRQEQARLAEDQSREAALRAAEEEVVAHEQRAEDLWRAARDSGNLPAYDRAAADLRLLGEAQELPRAFRRRGACLLALQRFADALEAFDRAESLAKRARGTNPTLELIEALGGRARAALLMGSPEQANAAAQAALELGREAPTSTRDLLLHLLALSATASDPPQGVAAAEAALAARAGEPRPPPFVAAYLCRFATMRGDLGAAAAALAKAPSAPDVEVEAARRALALATPPADARLFRRVLAIGPGALDDAIRFAQTSRGLNAPTQERERLELTRLAQRAFPWSPLHHYYLGKDLLNLGDDPSGALTHFRAAAWLDPFFENGRDFYLTALVAGEGRADHLEEALRYLRWWSARVPSDPNPRVRLAYVLGRLGRLREAWEAVEGPALETQPWRRALLLSALRVRADEAQREALPTQAPGQSQPPLEQPLPARFELVDDLLDAARIVLAMGDRAGAEQLLRQTRGLELKDNGRRDTLRYAERDVLEARCCAARGQGERALELLEQARLGPVRTRDGKSFSPHRAPGAAPAALRAYAEFGTLRDEPRFKALLESLRPR